jgi:hypothetical protein
MPNLFPAIPGLDQLMAFFVGALYDFFNQNLVYIVNYANHFHGCPDLLQCPHRRPGCPNPTPAYPGETLMEYATRALFTDYVLYVEVDRLIANFVPYNEHQDNRAARILEHYNECSLSSFQHCYHNNGVRVLPLRLPGETQETFYARCIIVDGGLDFGVPNFPAPGPLPQLPVGEVQEFFGLLDQAPGAPVPVPQEQVPAVLAPHLDDDDDQAAPASPASTNSMPSDDENDPDWFPQVFAPYQDVSNLPKLIKIFSRLKFAFQTGKDFLNIHI